MNALDVVRRIAGAPAADRLEDRVARMASVDLLLWCESTIAGIGKAFGDWQTSANPAIDSLAEAQMGTAALQTVLEELNRRRAAGVL